MHISPKDIVVYGVVLVSLAVVANHYARLNIPALAPLERMVFPTEPPKPHFQYGGDNDTTIKTPFKGSSSSSGAGSAKCVRAKTTGDTKSAIRNALKDAKARKDTYAVRELEEKLKDIELQEREACR